jgi:hypothetical protein
MALIHGGETLSIELVIAAILLSIAIFLWNIRR